MEPAGKQPPEPPTLQPAENSVRLEAHAFAQASANQAAGDVPRSYQAGARGATPGYDAFISYSHTLDGAVAQALQTGLERFAKPWYRPRALRVFRDTTNLSANPGLWSSIKAALASSTWLVLMASPKAARSQWVNREVAWWLANKSPQRLLVVLTEGEFGWPDETGHGDGAAAALPPALRGAFVEEPRWVDLRRLHTWTRWISPTPGCGSVWPTSPRLCVRFPRMTWWVSTFASTAALCGWLGVASPPWRCC
ncbi:MAG: toll/interleukin-1 receptor domain-containing protein [Actinomycetota bacterium]|nr:toll/interleukin-1 receptor domain-containing protein [Actinomycetota bacterium]